MLGANHNEDFLFIEVAIKHRLEIYYIITLIARRVASWGVADTVYFTNNTVRWVYQNSINSWQYAIIEAFPPKGQRSKEELFSEL